MINILCLILAFFMTFFMVGFSTIEIFFPKIAFRIKFPLYILSSLVISTFLIYIVAIHFGLTGTVVMATFFPFLPISLFFIYKLRSRFVSYTRDNFPAILFTVFVILFYFLALNPAILGKHDDYLVMSSVNWQDTALHLSITQSLTQGNFPPKAPYFSGAPLSYYYFTDFHSAIIGLMYGQTFPRVFVYDNALLAGVLALTVYSLAFEISKNKKLSIISSLMTSFYGSFIFGKFFQEIFKGGSAWEILANKTYSMEYNEIFGMANMADYYLQNRPMMIGLPVVIIVILLCVYGYKKEKLKVLLLAGLLSASLVKFQFFCVIACSISLFVTSTLLLKKKKFKFITKLKFIIKSYLLFLMPIFVFYLLFGTTSVNGTSFFDLVKNTFHFGVWDQTKPGMWHLKFILLNLGLPFLITLMSLVSSLKKTNKLLALLSLIFVAIPYVATFTIAEGDMLKFFYFAIVLFSIISVTFLNSVIKNKIILSLFLFITVFSSTFSSVLTLGNSYLNKNYGYSLDAYDAGIWVRQNTPPKSVFVTMPTVHSTPSDIGGRLRVISYINWPYSHGFNTGNDNVFSRVDDVTYVYNTGDIEKIKLKYGASYVFYGEEESDQFPDAGNIFDANQNLKQVYSHGRVKIYRII